MPTTTTYLDRLLDPLAEAFTPEVALTIANLRMDSETEARIEILREKANDGTLTPEEDVEYKEIVEAIDLIGILQMKARKSLAERSA